MLSNSHEALVQLFRDRPTLAAELLADPLELPLPAWQGVQLEPGDLTDIKPAEQRADTMVTLRDTTAKPVWGVIVEIQLHRDTRKRWRWPAYLGSALARYECPCVLLVISPDPAIARWCATPIDYGHPGLKLVPLVIGPDQVPVITDPGRAHNAPEMAVLSAFAHGADTENS